MLATVLARSRTSVASGEDARIWCRTALVAGLMIMNQMTVVNSIELHILNTCSYFYSYSYLDSNLSSWLQV